MLGLAVAHGFFVSSVWTFSSCSMQALEHMGLVAPWHMGTVPQTRDRTTSPALEGVDSQPLDHQEVLAPESWSAQ